MKKERIAYIDRLRGVNIFLVVMGHVITRNVIDGESAGILVFGSTFRMPLFMFLCGYIASKVIKPNIFDNYGLFILKKSRTLLLPFFAWPLLVDPFFFSDTLTFNFLDKIKELINGGGLWFLWYLFFVTLLYSLWLFLSDRLNKRKHIVWDVAFLLLIGLGLVGIWQLGVVGFMKQFMLFFVFYFAGVLIAKYDFLGKILINHTVFSIALLVFFVLVGHYEYGFSSLINTVIKISCAFSAIVIFYYLIRQLTWPPFVDKYIRLWGVNSLVIYVTHFYVAPIFPVAFISSQLNEIPLFLVTGVLTLVTVVVSMFIYKVFKMSDVLQFLLYGNKPTHY